jgi:hypothetical protein
MLPGGQGHGGQGGRRDLGWGRGRGHGHPPQANVGFGNANVHIWGQTSGQLSQTPAAPGNARNTPPHPIKYYATWNVCYLSGIDIEDWHTSATCPRKKAHHQNSFTKKNIAWYKNQGHKFSQKGFHKMQFLNFCGNM